MSTIFDLAKYILEQLGQISTMKLQKLCYYAQAWALVWDDAPLFEEDFQAWANGPVCPQLFSRLQGRFSVSARDVPGDSSVFSQAQRETIAHVLDYYGDKDAQWLSQLTHLEEPWRQARQNLPAGTPSKAIISKESMAMYYASL